MNLNIFETKIKLDTHDTHSKNSTIINNLTSEKLDTHVAHNQTHKHLLDTHLPIRQLHPSLARCAVGFNFEY